MREIGGTYIAGMKAGISAKEIALGMQPLTLGVIAEFDFGIGAVS